MLQHPHFDPVALRIGPLAVHWYGLMYLAGFALVYALGRWRIARDHPSIHSPPGAPAFMTARDLEDLIFYAVAGVVAGGRLGYVLFYNFGHYVARPWEIFYLWEGGMSFHGGLIGVVLVLLWFARRKGVTLLALGDFVAPLIPPALGAGRLGNFINGELWGRPTALPWGMVFAQAGGGPARHPSQLYELGLEGVALFALLWLFSAKGRPTGQISAMFLMGYGVLRFGVEFTREPDDFLGLLAGGLSMGQWLSLPMIALGAILFVVAAKRPSPP
jgi:phosphatidylglycerol:prolipoprotein diacylglycerol transferase